jgi:hypothetical protein
MSLLIYSGLLYLLGISILLYFKPEIMFTKEGSWKEFGLGRNHEQYTWMPFWLFSIIWAFVSYVIILVIASHTGLGGVSNANENQLQAINMNTMEPVKELTKKSQRDEANTSNANNTSNKVKKTPFTKNMKNGYYIVENGKPTYMGPHLPNLTSNMEGEGDDGFEESD